MKCTMEISKIRLEGALNYLIELGMSLLPAGGLNQMTFKGFFQPQKSYAHKCLKFLKVMSRCSRKE